MQNNIHNEAETWASAAATGALSDTEMAAWQEHIATCPGCRKRYEEELAMGKLITKTLDPESPDPGFEQRMIAKFRQKHAAEVSGWADFFRLPLILIGGGAGVVLAVVVGSAWLTKMGQPNVVAAAGMMTHAETSLADSLPDAVRQTLQAQAAGITIASVERADEDGNVAYEIVTITPEGEKQSLEIAADGTLLVAGTKLDGLPAAVRTAILAAVGTGKLESVDRSVDDGETTYIATVAANGREHDLTFQADGTLASAEVSRDELPAAVRAAITAQVGPGRLGDLEKTFDDGDTSYTATITTGGRERDFTFNEDGTLSSVEVDAAEVPAAVQTTLAGAVGSGRLEGIDKTFDDGTVTYDATISTPDGVERDVSISSDGRLLSRELTLTETPAPVRQTILQALGGGKLIEVDQSYASGNGAAPYEVEGLKDGKPFDFSVGQNGNVLGVED